MLNYSHCFSLLLQKRTLDFYCKNYEELEAWTCGLTHVLKKEGSKGYSFVEQVVPTDEADKLLASGKCSIDPIPEKAVRHQADGLFKYSDLSPSPGFRQLKHGILRAFRKEEGRRQGRQ